ncbi:leucine-rich repeat domain-containing protein [Haloferula sp. A504]|uniref:leucine-rich repeat domain-containing protein n=1 Tax=Haloferula sp. A504 TaxID=3373601 RepID=UPI0031C896DC|nr:leucine-rich repeat domain-containing protein [Verrucomicrobiaceae bacterium E54]
MPNLATVFGVGILTDLCAGQFGLFEYGVVEESTIEITGYPSSAVGAVSIPEEIEGKPVTSIGTYAFRDCAQIASVDLPSSLVSIGFGAFSGCRSLTSVEIPQGVTRIGVYAFQSCTGIESIFLPRNVFQVYGDSFSSCSNMTSIEVDGENPNYSSVDGVLFDQDLSELIRYPCGRHGVYSIPQGVTIVGRDAFSSCHELQAIHFPASVNQIEAHAFEFCSQITDVEIPGSVEQVGQYAFFGCSRLRSVLIHEGLSDLGVGAFKNCRRLADVVLPDTLPVISDSAFRFCDSLVTISLPSNLSSIGPNAFQGCDELAHITIPDTVVSIGDGAFGACQKLTTAVFLGDAPVLGSWVFISVDPTFSVYFLPGATGFDAPAWSAYTPLAVDPESEPMEYWLVRHGFLHSTSMEDDLNGDGVNLLLAYALNLDPRSPHSGMPRAEVDQGTLQMEFYASSPGVVYTVESSADLSSWKDSEVALSSIDSGGYRIASIGSASTHRFLRIKVE